MSERDDPERYGPIVKPPHWCDTCRGHTGPGSPCYDGREDEPEEAECADGVGASEQAQPFTFHWLVELRPAFEGHTPFPATYYAGWSEARGDAASSTNPHEAARFARKEDAERVASNLLSTLSCVWQAVEHGFATAGVKASGA